jgi:hypothetical protein
MEYKIYKNGVKLYTKDQRVEPIFFTKNIGKVFYRFKIGTISDVKHSGIFLGVDQGNTPYFIHNHYATGKAKIDPLNKFSQGKAIHLYEEKCTNEPRKVIRIALDLVKSGKPYDFLNYNCQTFSNKACHNQPISEDVQKWAGGIALFSLMALGVGLAFNNE